MTSIITSSNPESNNGDSDRYTEPKEKNNRASSSPGSESLVSNSLVMPTRPLLTNESISTIITPKPKQILIDSDAEHNSSIGHPKIFVNPVEQGDISRKRKGLFLSSDEDLSLPNKRQKTQPSQSPSDQRSPKADSIQQHSIDKNIITDTFDKHSFLESSNEESYFDPIDIFSTSEGEDEKLSTQPFQVNSTSSITKALQETDPTIPLRDNKSSENTPDAFGELSQSSINFTATQKVDKIKISETQTVKPSQESIAENLTSLFPPLENLDADRKSVQKARNAYRKALQDQKAEKSFRVFLAYETPDREEIADIVKQLTGGDLLSKPTMDSLNLAQRDYIPELALMPNLNSFSFYDVNLMILSQYSGKLLNKDPYLIYSPEKDKQLLSKTKKYLHHNLLNSTRSVRLRDGKSDTTFASRSSKFQSDTTHSEKSDASKKSVEEVLSPLFSPEFAIESSQFHEDTPSQKTQPAQIQTAPPELDLQDYEVEPLFEEPVSSPRLISSQHEPISEVPASLPPHPRKKNRFLDDPGKRRRTVATETVKKVQNRTQSQQSSANSVSKADEVKKVTAVINTNRNDVIQVESDESDEVWDLNNNNIEVIPSPSEEFTNDLNSAKHVSKSSIDSEKGQKGKSKQTTSISGTSLVGNRTEPTELVPEEDLIQSSSHENSTKDSSMRANTAVNIQSQPEPSEHSNNHLHAKEKESRRIPTLWKPPREQRNNQEFIAIERDDSVVFTSYRGLRPNSYTLEEDFTIIQATSDDRFRHGAVQKLFFEKLGKTVINRTPESIMSRYKKVILPRKDAILEKCRNKHIKALPLKIFFREYDSELGERIPQGSVPPGLSNAPDPNLPRMGNFGHEEDILLLKYVLGQETGVRGGNVIYKKFAQSHPWRSYQSWRNRYMKHLRHHIDTFFYENDHASIPMHLLPVFGGDGTGSSTNISTRANARHRRSAARSVSNAQSMAVLDSDDEMFRDERPANLTEPVDTSNEAESMSKTGSTRDDDLEADVPSTVEPTKKGSGSSPHINESNSQAVSSIESPTKKATESNSQEIPSIESPTSKETESQIDNPLFYGADSPLELIDPFESPNGTEPNSPVKASKQYWPHDGDVSLSRKGLEGSENVHHRSASMSLDSSHFFSSRSPSI